MRLRPRGEAPRGRADPTRPRAWREDTPDKVEAVTVERRAGGMGPACHARRGLRGGGVDGSVVGGGLPAGAAPPVPSGRAADQGQVRMSLSAGLRMIVSQRLVPTADRKSVVVAAEVLPGSVSLGNLIRGDLASHRPATG